ncbi:MAG: hypothetical protein JF590_00565 [Gemmatimonadetes bacterium]|nr:hypothetical protein [Gemmatimonadota bacterium]
MHFRALGTFFLLALTTTPAAAQDHPRLGFEFGTTRYGVIAHDNSSPRNELAPHQPLMATVRFTSHLGPLGIGLSLGRSWVDFQSTNGSGVMIVDENQATIWEFSPEVRFTPVRSAAGGRLMLHAGVIIDKWQIKDFEDRQRLGLIAGATAAANLGNGWDLEVRADLATTGSPFDPDEAGGGISLDRVRRTRLTSGLSRRL